MNPKITARLAVCLVAIAAAATRPAAAECVAPIAVQVLGSGGPDSSDGRAGAGYLVWIDGRARLLVDAGGGVFLRFGEAKAKFETLDAIAITHLHADHSSDLIALLKSAFFSERKAPLPLIGPSGGGAFPGMADYMRALLDPERGAYRYLSGYLDGTRGMVPAPVIEVDVASGTPKVIVDQAGLKVTAVGVKHGPVPALAYLVEAGNTRIAFSGDQNGDNPAFATLISSADVLIMDHAIPETAGETEVNLHARPSEIGQLAAAASVKRLILSHNMARSLTRIDESRAQIRRHYAGPVVVADDLMCVDLR